MIGPGVSGAEGHHGRSRDRDSQYDFELSVHHDPVSLCLQKTSNRAASYGIRRHAAASDPPWSERGVRQPRPGNVRSRWQIKILSFQAPFLSRTKPRLGSRHFGYSKPWRIRRHGAPAVKSTIFCNGLDTRKGVTPRAKRDSLVREVDPKHQRSEKHPVHGEWNKRLTPDVAHESRNRDPRHHKRHHEADRHDRHVVAGH